MKAIQISLIGALSRLYKIRLDSSFFVMIVRVFFIILFLYSSASKLIGYDTFQLQISKSPIITDAAQVLIWMIPSLEIIISVMLLVRRTLLAGLYGAFGLMMILGTYIVGVIGFAENVPCSCIMIFKGIDWKEHLIFNMALVVLALAGVFLQEKINRDRI